MMKLNGRYFIAVGLAATLLLSACGSSDNDNENSQPAGEATLVPTIMPADQGAGTSPGTQTGASTDNATPASTTNTGSNTTSGTGTTDATATEAAGAVATATLATQVTTDTIGTTGAAAAGASSATTETTGAGATGATAAMTDTTGSASGASSAGTTGTTTGTMTDTTGAGATGTTTGTMTDTTGAGTASTPAATAAMTDTTGSAGGTSGASTTGTTTGTMTDTTGAGAAATPAATEAMTDTTGADANAGALGAAGTGALTDTTGLGPTGDMTAPGALPAATNNGEPYSVVGANELLKYSVVNTAGDNLGSISDAVVSLPDGCLNYMVLTTGEILGLGGTDYLIPWEAVGISTADQRLILNVDQNVIKGAPVFDKNNLPDMTNPTWNQAVNSYWQTVGLPAAPAVPNAAAPGATGGMTDTTGMGATGATTAATGAMTDTTGMSTTGAMTDTTGAGAASTGAAAYPAVSCRGVLNMASGATNAGSSSAMTTGSAASTGAMTGTEGMTGTAAGGDQLVVQNPTAMRLSDLLGFKVKNSNGDELGGLEDIMVDWQHDRLAYTILSVGGFFGLGDKWFPIPLDAVRLNPVDKALVFDIDKSRIEQAPGFDPNQLPDVNNPNWDENIRSFWGLQ